MQSSRSDPKVLILCTEKKSNLKKRKDSRKRNTQIGFQGLLEAGVFLPRGGILQHTLEGACNKRARSFRHGSGEPPREATDLIKGSAFLQVSHEFPISLARSVRVCVCVCVCVCTIWIRDLKQRRSAAPRVLQEPQYRKKRRNRVILYQKYFYFFLHTPLFSRNSQSTPPPFLFTKSTPSFSLHLVLTFPFSLPFSPYHT